MYSAQVRLQGEVDRLRAATEELAAARANLTKVLQEQQQQQQGESSSAMWLQLKSEVLFSVAEST